MNWSNCRLALIYANGGKLVDISRLSPIGLLLGVSFTWSCCQEVEIYPKSGQKNNY